MCVCIRASLSFERCFYIKIGLKWKIGLIELSDFGLVAPCWADCGNLIDWSSRWGEMKVLRAESRLPLSLSNWCSRYGGLRTPHPTYGASVGLSWGLGTLPVSHKITLSHREDAFASVKPSCDKGRQCLLEAVPCRECAYRGKSQWWLLEAIPYYADYWLGTSRIHQPDPIIFKYGHGQISTSRVILQLCDCGMVWNGAET